jgi:hypothetical protein
MREQLHRALRLAALAACASVACVNPDPYHAGADQPAADAGDVVTPPGADAAPDRPPAASVDARDAADAPREAALPPPDAGRDAARDMARDAGRDAPAPPADAAGGCTPNPSLDIICAGQPHWYFCSSPSAPPPAPACVLRTMPGDANPVYCCP